MTQTLFEKYGGYPTVQILVEKFYQKVMDDPLLQHFFESTDWKRLIKHQVAFVSQVMGGPVVYKGLDMAKAHKRFNITDSHFDAVASHLLSTITELGVAAEDIDTIMAAVGGLREKIVHAIDPKTVSLDKQIISSASQDTEAELKSAVQEIILAKESIIAQKNQEILRLMADIEKLTAGRELLEVVYNLRKAKEVLERLELANQKTFGGGAERRFLIAELKQLI